MAKILCLDDDPASLRIISTFLKKAGFDVVDMSSGREAICYLNENELVDMIISDIMMPDIDGFGVLKAIKATPKLAAVPVILCSALNDKESVIRGIKLGASGYISKPIQANVLVEKVKAVLDKAPGAILVVDDEEIIRDMLVRILESGGYKVIGALSGTEALEVLKSRKISLVLSDMQMPEMNGLELLKSIKSETPDLPVMIMSGYGNESTISNVTSAGADGYIAKPFRNTEILLKIKHLFLDMNAVTSPLS